jgi:hypothetical protein
MSGNGVSEVLARLIVEQNADGIIGLVGLAWRPVAGG